MAKHPLIKDFSDWSGGFEPHETSDKEITSYVNSGRPSSYSAKRAHQVIHGHIKKYGAGHDMTAHGEGKKHGEK